MICIKNVPYQWHAMDEMCPGDNNNKCFAITRRKI